MKALILAAGYATRLYPLTKDFPKPLLEVGGKTILDRLLEQVASIPQIDRVYLVTNSRFLRHFEAWRDQRPQRPPIDLIDDGTASNDDRRGAIGDIQFAIRARGIAEDLLICAADNILQFPLAGFAAAFRARPAPHICARYVEDIVARRRTGIVVLDADNRVLEFAEKPQHPKTCWGVPPLYLYPRPTLARIEQYLEAGGTPDAPGHFVEWLIRNEPVYAYRIEGSVLDIGNLESLEAARKVLGGG